jgi:hypothetical protein
MQRDEFRLSTGSRYTRRNALDPVETFLTTSRHRFLLTAVFALLFLFMQREVQVHALQHLGGLLHPAQQQSLQAPAADVTCLECSLLASGSPGIAADLAAMPPAAVTTQRIYSAVAARRLAAPSYYSSRAPPQLL